MEYSPTKCVLLFAVYSPRAPWLLCAVEATDTVSQVWPPTGVPRAPVHARRLFLKHVRWVTRTQRASRVCNARVSPPPASRSLYTDWWLVIGDQLCLTLSKNTANTVLSCNLKYNVVLDTGEELTRLFCQLYFDDSPNAISWFQNWKLTQACHSKSKVLILRHIVVKLFLLKSFPHERLLKA